jgi:hypothetical protein
MAHDYTYRRPRSGYPLCRPPCSTRFATPAVGNIARLFQGARRITGAEPDDNGPRVRNFTL